MLELEDALQRIIATIPALPWENILSSQSARRWLAQDVAALVSLPAFDNSAMDGYAVRSADVARAGVDSPVTLQCVASIPAGTAAAMNIQPGTCLRLFTGSPLPSGADAVVMQEDTHRTGDAVQVLDAVKPWEHVRLQGEDVKAGQVVVHAGERVTAARLAVLLATGVERIAVTKKPDVAILGTGQELIEAGRTLAPGQIFESNRAVIASLVEGLGGQSHIFPIVRDSLEETRQALKTAFEQCDVVITTGGVSVGEHDMVKPALEALGGTLEFWKVAIKPGKPFVFGRWEGKLLFGLPGNPVSAFVTFLLLVRPALLGMQRAVDLGLPGHSAVLAEPLRNPGDRRHFMRVCVDSSGQVRSAGLQASHALSSLAQANGLVCVPPGASWPVGQSVQVLRWEW